VERCRSRPIAHVAAEMGIARACASKWVNRYRHYGELGLHDRSSTPQQSPNATPAWVLEKLETWRREQVVRQPDYPRAGRAGIPDQPAHPHEASDPARAGKLPVSRPHRRRNRPPRKIVARWPGHMAHLDVKKVGRIPDPAGLHRASTRRQGPHRSRVPGPGERLVRRPRDRPHPPCRDRQRRLLRFK
jgi:hypothetical protein